MFVNITLFCVQSNILIPIRITKIPRGSVVAGEFVRIEDFMEQADKELLEVSGDKLRKRMQQKDEGAKV